MVGPVSLFDVECGQERQGSRKGSDVRMYCMILDGCGRRDVGSNNVCIDIVRNKQMLPNLFCNTIYW